jgi:hypothetical protein
MEEDSLDTMLLMISAMNVKSKINYKYILSQRTEWSLNSQYILLSYSEELRSVCGSRTAPSEAVAKAPTLSVVHPSGILSLLLSIPQRTKQPLLLLLEHLDLLVLLAALNPQHLKLLFLTKQLLDLIVLNENAFLKDRVLSNALLPMLLEHFLLVFGQHLHQNSGNMVWRACTHNRWHCNLDQALFQSELL